MLFHFMHIHRRKFAALLMYTYAMQLGIPCLAIPNPGYLNSQANYSVRMKSSENVSEKTIDIGNAFAGLNRNNKFRMDHPVARFFKKNKGPGPGQPEQKSFESVNAKNMVDLFSGDFSYNIPLMDVGGYPVAIHYRSGITMDQEASWVGLGWNLQPGSLNRNMRGIPDDFDGDLITKTENIKTNWTAGINAGAGAELFGLPANIDLHAGLFYNNYRGVGFETGAGINVSLTASKGAQGGLNGGLGINLNNNSQNGFSIEPSFNLKRTVLEENVTGKSTGFSIGASLSTRNGIKDMSFGLTGAQEYSDNKKDLNMSSGSAMSGSLNFALQAYTPKMNIAFTSYQFNFTFRPGLEFFGAHPYLQLGGYYSSQYVAPADVVLSSPAYGYMYLQDGLSNPKALLDFNRE